MNLKTQSDVFAIYDIPEIKMSRIVFVYFISKSHTRCDVYCYAVMYCTVSVSLYCQQCNDYCTEILSPQ